MGRTGSRCRFGWAPVPSGGVLVVWAGRLRSGSARDGVGPQREASEPGEAVEEQLRPGAVAGVVQDPAAAGVDESASGGEEPEPESLGFPPAGLEAEAVLGGEGQHLGPRGELASE